MEGTGNLIDYLYWRSDIPEEVAPFNEVDWMVFARLTYSPFSWLNMEEETAFTPLPEMMNLLLTSEEIHDKVKKTEDFTMYALLRDSRRYAGFEIGNYVDIFDVDRDLQFSAYTLRIPGKRYVIVFRGTDETIVGVKEDLNMAFQCPVEAQNLAASYVNAFMNTHEGRYIFCGHSKGGNLAAYAASFCRYEFQERVDGVYNYDGPGFDDMVLVTPQYQNICGRIHTFVPQSSMVGMLLGHLEDHIVISSTAQMAGQHNMYTWEVTRDHFVYEQETTAGSKYFDRTMKDWLAHMEKGKREAFVEAVFDVVERMNIRTMSDLRKNWLGNSIALIQEMKNMDEETRRTIMEGFGILVKSAQSNLIRKPEQLKEEEKEPAEIGDHPEPRLPG